MFNETNTLAQAFQPFNMIGTGTMMPLIPLIIFTLVIFARGLGIFKVALFMTLAITMLQYIGIMDIGSWIFAVWAMFGIVIIYTILEHSVHEIPSLDMTKIKRGHINILMSLGIDR